MMLEEEVIVGSNSDSTTPVSHLNYYSPNSIASPGGRNSSTRPQPQSQPNRWLFVTEEEEKKDNHKRSCFHCHKHGHWIKDCPMKSPKTPSSSQSPSPSSPSPIGGHGVPNLICPCGTGTCSVRRSKTTRNSDRLFYCCPLRDKSCNFFVWCDEVWNDKITVPVCCCVAGPCSIYKEPSFTRSNAGRYFFVCPIKKGQGACGFIQSLDATNGHSDRSIISQSTLTNCHDTSPSSSDLVEDGDFSQQGMDVESHSNTAHCNYFKFVDEDDEDVTSIIRSNTRACDTITVEDFNDLRTRLHDMEDENDDYGRRLERMENNLKAMVYFIIFSIILYFMM